MRPHLKAILGYVAFGLAAFVFGLYVTFPYDTLKRFVVGQAEAQGLQVQIGSLGPGLFGVTASNVKVASKSTGDKPSEPLQLDSVSFRPALFPLGVAVRGNAMGGKFSANVGGIGDLSVHADFDELDPSKGNFKGFTGIVATGTASGSLDLDIPKTAPGLDGKPHDPNLAEANGNVALNLGHFVIQSGEIVIPLYGTPTPMGLPQIALGNADVKLAISKGNGKFEKLSAKSDDLELNGGGTIRLARRLEYSELNLDLKLKPDPAFVKRLGPIGMGLNMLPADPGAPGFREAKVTGMLANPQLAGLR